MNIPVLERPSCCYCSWNTLFLIFAAIVEVASIGYILGFLMLLPVNKTDANAICFEDRLHVILLPLAYVLLTLSKLIHIIVKDRSPKATRGGLFSLRLVLFLTTLASCSAVSLFVDYALLIRSCLPVTATLVSYLWMIVYSYWCDIANMSAVKEGDGKAKGITQ